MRSVVKTAHRSQCLAQLRTGRSEGAQVGGIHWHMKVHPPALGVEKLCRGPRYKVRFQVVPAQHRPRGANRRCLMQVPPFDIRGQRGPPRGIPRGIVQLHAAGDVHLVDPDVVRPQCRQRFANRLELHRLVADVVADTQVALHWFRQAPPRRGLPQFGEERDGLGSCFQHAQGLGLNGQADGPPRGLLEGLQVFRQCQQLSDAGRLKVLPQRERLEAQGDRRDAPLAPRWQQPGQHAGASERVLQARRVGPVGQVDLLFDPLGMEIAVGKRVQRVTRQLPVGQCLHELLTDGGRAQQFPDDRSREPQPRRDGAADTAAHGESDLSQAREDLGDTAARMNVGAIAQWQSGERHRGGTRPGQGGRRESRTRRERR